jgi:hypothetical protein
METVKDNIGK